MNLFGKQETKDWVRKMDSQKLKAIIKSQGKTYKQCADAIHKSLPSFDRKISGKQKFPVNEMEELGNFLGMSGQEKAEVFLGREREVRNVADLDLRKCIQEKLSDLDGTSFLIRLYSNGKAMNGLVDDVASAISKHDLTASEAKGFLEYMKLVIDGRARIPKEK